MYDPGQNVGTFTAAARIPSRLVASLAGHSIAAEAACHILAWFCRATSPCCIAACREVGMGQGAQV
jgi:hypothetical protein